MELVELVVVVRITGPEAADALDLIRSDIAALVHLCGHGDTLSGAKVVEVRS